MTEQEYRARLRCIADEYVDKKLALSRVLACSRNTGARIKTSSIKHSARGYYLRPWFAGGAALLQNKRYITGK